ncbi:SDR family NAD(P)-dependent oxidoreductase [Streptomyces bottropensis]|uniref:SDR family NAD(P)-dependent oxidoreductase n=1 Tax=Streptomyces bottropensis TaxID=42235 RepID=UPI0037FD4BA6
MEGPLPVGVRSEPGRHGPLHCTSMGKVLMAFAPDDVRADLLDHVELTPHGPNSVTDRDVLRAHVARAAELCYATADEEHHPGLRAVAVPILRPDGTVFAALSTAAPRLPPQHGRSRRPGPAAAVGGGRAGGPAAVPLTRAPVRGELPRSEGEFTAERAEDMDDPDGKRAKPLDGKTALVTGAGTGIGRETALMLAEAGATVVLVGRRRQVLDEVAAAVTDAGGAAFTHPAHVENADEVRELADRTREFVGPVDILVHNAGGAGPVGDVRGLGEDEWNAVLGVNLTGVYLLTQALLPDMLERGGGSVIAISSLAALRPTPLGGAPYGAAKAGVRNFMAYLRNSFRDRHIRATCILPGAVDTPAHDSRPAPPSAERRAAMVRPEDVARAVLLCATLPARTVVEELVIAPTVSAPPRPGGP